MNSHWNRPELICLYIESECGHALAVRQLMAVPFGVSLRAGCSRRPSPFYFPNALSNTPLIYDSSRSDCLRNTVQRFHQRAELHRERNLPIANVAAIVEAMVERGALECG